MNLSDYFDSIAAGVAFPTYASGTRLIVAYPRTQMTWHFYLSATTYEGGPASELKALLKDGGIKGTGKLLDAPLNSNFEKPGNIRKSFFNHEVAVGAQRQIIEREYGTSLIDDVQTSRKGVSSGNFAPQKNMAGRSRWADLAYKTKSLWTGATIHYDEVKTGQANLTSKGVAQQANADVRNLKDLNAKVAGVRLFGQGLRVAGVAGIAYDVGSTGVTFYGQLQAGERPDALDTGARFSTNPGLHCEVFR